MKTHQLIYHSRSQTKNRADKICAFAKENSRPNALPHHIPHSLPKLYTHLLKLLNKLHSMKISVLFPLHLLLRNCFPSKTLERHSKEVKYSYHIVDFSREVYSFLCK